MTNRRYQALRKELREHALHDSMEPLILATMGKLADLASDFGNDGRSPEVQEYVTLFLARFAGRVTKNMGLDREAVCYDIIQEWYRLREEESD